MEFKKPQHHGEDPNTWRVNDSMRIPETRVLPTDVLQPAEVSAVGHQCNKGPRSIDIVPDGFIGSSRPMTDQDRAKFFGHLATSQMSA